MTSQSEVGAARGDGLEGGFFVVGGRAYRVGRVIFPKVGPESVLLFWMFRFSKCWAKMISQIQFRRLQVLRVVFDVCSDVDPSDVRKMSGPQIHCLLTLEPGGIYHLERIDGDRYSQ